MVRGVETVTVRQHPLPRDVVTRCASVLAGGGLLAHPTSTVYGLGGRADEELDAEICRLKGRPADRPLIRLAASAEALAALRPELSWDCRAEILTAEFWPGPLTLVLDDGSERGLGVRVDPHPFLQSVLEEFGDLMSSTSLNEAGDPPAMDAEAARRVLESWPETERPCVLADAGRLPPSPPSTVLSLRQEPPRILRAGAVSAERLRTCLGREITE